MGKRTDLALEEKELYEGNAQSKTKLEGVVVRESEQDGVKFTHVEILNEQAAEQLHKPVGNYLTLEFGALLKRRPELFSAVSGQLGSHLAHLMQLGPADTVLVVGLGNLEVTPDAVGPKSLSHLLVTRHLVERYPSEFGRFRATAALQPGVLGTTGLESAEVIRGVLRRCQPDCLIVIDALAACDRKRLCSTIQIADTGIVPGSGVGNSRAALNRETLGVPVFAIGVPTVVELETLLDGRSRPEDAGGDMIVTPSDIDARVRSVAKIIGYGINRALYPDLSGEEIAQFVE